jgi:hypothetical protein
MVLLIGWRNQMDKNAIAIKIYNQNGEVLLAACDEILLGKEFEEGELQLQVHTAFYDGFRVDEQGFLNQLGNSTIANLVGERVIQYALEAGFVSEDCIIRIQGIPHVQIYRMA